MARLTSRSASRGVSSTPKPSGSTTKPKVTRSTRSQSKDLGENDVAVPGRQTRSARQTSTESTKNKAKKPSQRQKDTKAAPAVIKDLSTVEEDIEEEEEKEEEGEEDQVQEDISGPSKSTADTIEAANISGTTAHEPESQDMSDLNTDLMLAALPSLDQYSNEIIKQFPFPLTTDLIINLKNLLQNPRSKLSLRMKDLLGHLQVSKNNFGDDLFIENEIILLKLFGSLDTDDDYARPDPIIYKTNIAVFLEILLVQNFEEDELKDFIDKLDDTFPSLFIPSHMVEVEFESDTEFWDELLELALEIRTQFVILALQYHQGSENFDPDALIAQTFHQGDDDMSTEDILHEGQPKRIAGLSQLRTNQLKKRIVARIDEIRDAFIDDTQAHATKEYVAMDELRSKFPWDGFVIQLSKWLQHRAGEYESYIQDAGGIDKVIQLISERIPNDEHDITLNFGPIVPPSELSNDGNVESAVERKKRIAALAQEILKPSSHVAPQQRKIVSESVVPDRRFTADPSKAAHSKPESLLRQAERIHAENQVTDLGANDYMETETSNATPDLRKITGRWNGVEKEKNKENNKPTKKRNFLDAQAGAKKVDFDDDDEDDAEIPDKRSQNQRKRSQEEAGIGDDDDGMFVPQGAESNVSEDEGFEEDQREENRSRRSGKVVTSPKKPRLDFDQVPKRRPRQNDRAEEDQAEKIVPVPSQAYREINTQAKKQVAQNKSLTSQTRVPWTPAECEALVDLISEYGNGFAQISKQAAEDDLISERHREQVALKDKARNMKVDYLLSQQPLPDNFDHIKLGKKEKERVIKAGLNPYRREGEEVGEESLDENGEPWE